MSKYKFINYENLKGLVLVERDGVLVKIYQKCVIFYTSQSFLRVSVGSCLEYRALDKLTDDEKKTIIDITKQYLPNLLDKVSAVLNRVKQKKARVNENSPIFDILQGITFKELLLKQNQTDNQVKTDNQTSQTEGQAISQDENQTEGQLTSQDENQVKVDA